MRFAELASLWALAAAPLVGLLILISVRRRRRAMLALAEPSLLSRLVTTARPEWRALRALLVVSGIALTALALARPQWGMSLDPVVRRGVDVVLAFDVSSSMLAEDLRPSRLAKAQREAVRLLEALGGDRVAVVAFAGSAAKLCPLTLDHAAAHLFIDALDTDLLSDAGTSLGNGLDEVVSVFKGGNRRYRAAVFFSDGEDHAPGLEEALARAAEAGIVIHTVGVGTAGGGPIPLRDERGVVRGYKEDAEGRVVTSRLEEAALGRIAEETGGEYLPSTPGGGEIERIAEAIESMEQQEMEQRLLGRFEERFQIPLAAALLLMILEPFVPSRRRKSHARGPLRPGAASAILIGALLWGAPPAQAASAASLLDEGNRHFQEGRYDEALRYYTQAQVENPEAPEVHLSIGNVLYRKGEFEKAGEAYRRALSSRLHHLEGDTQYNSGTASLASGDLPEAVNRFREALTLDPADEDARRNLELALRRMQQEQPPPQQQQQEQEQQQQKQEQKESSSQEEKPDESQEQQKAGEEEQEDPSREEQEPSQAEERKERGEAERILDALKGEDRPRVDPRRQRRPERPPAKDW